MEHRRRTFLIGLGGLLVAPAIVRASSLMPVSTNLMRFSASDALMRKVIYRPILLNYWRRCITRLPEHIIVAAKISPFNGSHLLLTDKGEIIDTTDKGEIIDTTNKAMQAFVRRVTMLKTLEQLHLSNFIAIQQNENIDYFNTDFISYRYSPPVITG